MVELKNKTIVDIRKATGLSVNESQKFVEEKSETLCQKIILASLQQKKGAETDNIILHDPIEDDPKFSSIIKTARNEAEQLTRLKTQAGIEKAKKKRKRIRGNGLEKKRKSPNLESNEKAT